MKIYSVLLIFLLMSCAYDPGDKRLKTINKMDHEIVVYWDSDTIPKYPSINETEVYLRYKIKRGDTLSQPEDDSNWPMYVRNSLNKKLNLFVYNVDTLMAYNSIDTLNAKKMYRRLEYSEQELDKLNWIVIIKD